MEGKRDGQKGHWAGKLLPVLVASSSALDSDTHVSC